jgi:hypothetical protein
MPEQLVGTVEELGPGSVRGIGDWAVLNVDGARTSSQAVAWPTSADRSAPRAKRQLAAAH